MRLKQWVGWDNGEGKIIEGRRVWNNLLLYWHPTGRGNLFRCNLNEITSASVAIVFCPNKTRNKIITKYPHSSQEMTEGSPGATGGTTPTVGVESKEQDGVHIPRRGCSCPLKKVQPSSVSCNPLIKHLDDSPSPMHLYATHPGLFLRCLASPENKKRQVDFKVLRG